MSTDKRIKCKMKLIEVAKARRRIPYGALAAHVGGVLPIALGQYLNPIYEEEMALGRPDLTLVVVKSGSRYGNYNSRGGPAQSKKFDPNDPADRKAYDEDLGMVYDYWASH